MTEILAAGDSSDFVGVTILVGGDDIGYRNNVFVSGFQFIKFILEDNFLDFISLMGNNMTPNAIAVFTKIQIFLFDLYKFFENERTEEGTLLNSTNNSFDPFHYHLAKCGEGAFKTMECNQVNKFYPNEKAEEDDDVQRSWRAQRKSDARVDEQSV